MKKQVGYSKGILAIVMLLGIATLTAINTNADPTVATDPVGFITQAAVPAGLTYMSLGMTKVPVARGVIGQINTSGLNLVDLNQSFAPGVGTNYFIEFTSGAAVGVEDDITNTAAGAYFTAFTNYYSMISSGDTYKVYPHWTPDSVFGSPSQSGLVGGSSAGNADNVIVWNPNTQQGVTYYWRTSGTPGWRGPQGAAVNAGTNIWYLDQGLYVLRRAGTTNINEILVGGVKLGQTVVPIVAGPGNYTWAGYVYASGFTMDSTGLYTTNTATGVQGGSSAGAADNVIIWSASGQSGITYYWRTTGTPGWRGPQGAAVNAGTNAIPMGSVLKVYRRSLGAFNWNAPAPY